MTGSVDPQLRDIFDSMLAAKEPERCQACVLRSAVVSGDRNIFVFGGTLHLHQVGAEGSAKQPLAD